MWGPQKLPSTKFNLQKSPVMLQNTWLFNHHLDMQLTWTYMWSSAPHAREMVVCTIKCCLFVLQQSWVIYNHLVSIAVHNLLDTFLDYYNRLSNINLPWTFRLYVRKQQSQLVQKALVVAIPLSVVRVLSTTTGNDQLIKSSPMSARALELPTWTLPLLYLWHAILFGTMTGFTKWTNINMNITTSNIIIVKRVLFLLLQCNLLWS